MNTFNFTETRNLHKEDIMNLCIANHWYTKGDNESYKNFLNGLECTNLTTEKIVIIANHIAFHSELNTDYTERENISNICFKISRACYSLFE